MPEISVLIPSYNRAAILPRALRSVQAQDFDSLEIIIVDDGSTDETKAVVEEQCARDPRIRYLPHLQNRGEAAARNTAISAAKGKYIGFLDSDDEWLPGKLLMQHEYMENASPDLAGVVTANIVASPDGSRNLEDAWHFHQPITAEAVLINGCCLGLGNMLLRAAPVKENQSFDESMKLFVDIDWIVRFLIGNRIEAVFEPFTLYQKAPMRAGGVIRKAADEFLEKKQDLLKQFESGTQRKFQAMLWRSIAAGYQAENQDKDYSKALARSLWYNPITRPGNYIALIDSFLGTNIVNSIRAIKQKPN